MDTTLVINPGSASKKYALYRNGAELFSVLFEHTETGFGKCVEVNRTRQHCEETTAGAYDTALQDMLSLAMREHVIERKEDITHIGIRIVAPGTFFEAHRRIDLRYRKLLEAVAEYAPLHIPHILEELHTVLHHFPDTPIVGVSDSAFHSSMAPYAREYSILAEDALALDIRRFGYHGISVASCLPRAYKIFGTHPERMVVCHIGSGVSVTALKDGKSVDTTMGFGPGSGLMMSTRAGEIDPSALFALMHKKKLSYTDAEQYVNLSGGLKGMLGESDLRIALDRSARGDRSALIATEKFFYGIRKAIGSFAMILGGLDALVFTATAAERNPVVRMHVSEGVEAFGGALDAEANDVLIGKEGVISTPESKVLIGVVHTHEMEMIAREAEMIGKKTKRVPHRK